MRPELWRFELFGHPVVVHGYGLAIGIGFVLLALVVRLEARRAGHEQLAQRAVRVVVWLGLAVYLGGKLLYWAARPSAFGDFSGEGFVFYGSLLAAIPTALWLARDAGVRPLELCDFVFLGAPLTHAFGRLGCFLAGCCYGVRCDTPWAVTFTDGVGLRGEPLHPVQLYEAAGSLAIFLYLYLYLRPRRRWSGQIFFRYLILYAALRLVTEAFRGDPARRFLIGGGDAVPGERAFGLSTSVVTSLAMLVLVPLSVHLLARSGRLQAVARTPR